MGRDGLRALIRYGYFVEVMRTIYLGGGGVAELLPQLEAVLVFALVFNLWAVKSYKKSS